MSKKVTIDQITPPGQPDGDKLLKYYFEKSGDGYNLYAPTGGDPVNHQLFTPENPVGEIHVHGRPYTITITAFPVEIIKGLWSDNRGQVIGAPGGGVTGASGSGSFQAQAGTTPVEEEEASAASA